LFQVPYFRSGWAHCDITHCRSFTIESMEIFVAGSFHQAGYQISDMSFSGREVFLDTEYKSTFARRLFSSLALWRSYWFENSIWSFVYPFEQLTFLLTK
jgi:hypothetical protein